MIVNCQSTTSVGSPTKTTVVTMNIEHMSFPSNLFRLRNSGTMRKLGNLRVCTIIPNKLIQFIKIIPFDVILPLRDINNKVGRKFSFLFQEFLNFIKALGIKIKLNVGNLFCQLITSDKIVVINNLTRAMETKRLNRIATLLKTIILNHLEAKVRIITHNERILSIRGSDCVIVKLESFNCITRMLT